MVLVLDVDLGHLWLHVGHDPLELAHLVTPLVDSLLLVRQQCSRAARRSSVDTPGPSVGSAERQDPSRPQTRAVCFRAAPVDVARRMVDIFLLDADGKRPVWGGAAQFQDPLWRDEILFYEYFHGDNGAGIGASHQTGWTALVANLIDEWR